MKKAILLLSYFIILMLTNKIDAASVVIKSVWLEHSVYENGVKGMKIHVHFTIHGMLGIENTCTAYFESPKGKGLKDYNDSYCTKDGSVCCSKSFTPRYANSEYSDFTLFIPLSELHLPSGENTIYADIRIHSKSTGFWSDAKYVSFIGTGNSKQMDFTPEDDLEAELARGNKSKEKRDSKITCGACNGSGKVNCYLCSGTGKTQQVQVNYTTGTYYYVLVNCGACRGTGRVSCVGCSGSGYVKIPEVNQSNGYSNNRSYSVGSKGCIHCGGTGTCPECGGTGTKYNPTTGHTLECTYCHGSTKCYLCKGRGSNQ